MNARELNEAQLVELLPQFLHQLSLTLLGEEVCVGAFRFDALARDHEGSIVVIEFKANASQTTLHQLLIYSHVVATRIAHGGLTDRRVRSVLITTQLDSNVVEVTARLRPIADISLMVCVGDTDKGFQLVDPNAAANQVWDQAKEGKRQDVFVVDGKLVVKGIGE